MEITFWEKEISGRKKNRRRQYDKLFLMIEQLDRFTPPVI